MLLRYLSLLEGHSPLVPDLDFYIVMINDIVDPLKNRGNIVIAKNDLIGEKI
ncbi:MAG: hypothetical protein ACFFD4_35185 [Candidatus Odinarchaeota archaeon]